MVPSSRMLLRWVLVIALAPAGAQEPVLPGRLVTRDAVATGRETGPIDLASAPLAGFAGQLGDGRQAHDATLSRMPNNGRAPQGLPGSVVFAPEQPAAGAGS